MPTMGGNAIVATKMKMNFHVPGGWKRESA